MRDYVEWHAQYDNPDSGMSWRLRTVQRRISKVLDASDRPLRVLSSCAGDGRDVLDVLAARDDRGRFDLTLVEIHPELAARARAGAAEVTPARLDVRMVDAGWTSAYAGAVPADLLLLVGILGNLDDADVARTVAAVPRLCAHGATVLWTRGRLPDRGEQTCRLFDAVGCRELAYDTLDRGSHPAVGTAVFEGDPQPLGPDERLFTFRR